MLPVEKSLPTAWLCAYLSCSINIMFLQHNTRTLLFIPIGLYYLLIMQEWLIYINILLRIKTIRLKATSVDNESLFLGSKVTTKK